MMSKSGLADSGQFRPGDHLALPGGEDETIKRPSDRRVSPHGSAHLTAALTAVERWLRRTYQLVPADRESEALDLEISINRFLDEAS
ncbi:hypothetical protein [Streptomyces sp. NPDC001020]